MVPVLRGAIEYQYEGIPGEMVRAFVCRTCRQVTWVDSAVWEGKAPTHIRPRDDHGISYKCRYLSAPEVPSKTPSATSDVDTHDNDPLIPRVLDTDLIDATKDQEIQHKIQTNVSDKVTHSKNCESGAHATREYIMAWGLSDGGRSPLIGQKIQNLHLPKIHGLDSEPQGEIKDKMTTRHDRKHKIETEDEDKGRKSYDKGKGPA